jgi:hypothetical protein
MLFSQQSNRVGSVRKFRALLAWAGPIIIAGSATWAVGGLFDSKTASDPSSQGKKQSKTTAEVREDVPKLPVPSEMAQKAAEKQIAEVMGDTLTKAKTADEKKKAAAQMLQTAGETADATPRYVLLKGSQNLSADAHDIDAALAAHAELTKAYLFDTPKASADIFQKLTSGPLNADDSSKVAEAAMADVAAAIASDRYDVARQVGRYAVACAKKANDAELSKRADSIVASASTLETEHARVVSSEETLKKKPDDAAANTAVGRFECFVKKDWKTGLPMLAKGSDATLKQMAGDELRQPASPQDQLAIADGWWAMADKSPATQKDTIHAHAGEWYAKAAPNLSGLGKMKAEQRAAANKPDEVASASGTGSKPLKGFKGPAVAGTPQAAEFQSPLQVLQAVPAELFPRTNAWTPAQQKAVNDALTANVSGHPATFLVHVDYMSETTSSPYIWTRDIQVGQIPCQVYVNFSEEGKTEAAQLRIGYPCVVSGTISSAHFFTNRLSIQLTDCKVVRR